MSGESLGLRAAYTKASIAQSEGEALGRVSGAGGLVGVNVPASLRVTLILDREDRHRGDFWSDILDHLRTQGIVDTTVTRCYLADLLDQPLDPGRPTVLETLQQSTDILILNWDVVNGDPDFGADEALAWFHHRRLGIRTWLNDGGILILEGQAVLGVPSAEAYAAVLGADEVAVCGPEDDKRPELNERRMVGECRTTKVCREAPGFQGLERITPRQELSFDGLFPPATAGRLVAAYIRRVDVGNSLYRGWFRRRFSRRATLMLGAVRQTRLLLALELPDTSSCQMRQPWRDIRYDHVALRDEPDKVDPGDPPSSWQCRFPTGAVQNGPTRRTLLPKAVAGLSTGLIVLTLSSYAPVEKAVLSAAVGIFVTISLDLIPLFPRAVHLVVRRITGA